MASEWLLHYTLLTRPRTIVATVAEIPKFKVHLTNLRVLR